MESLTTFCYPCNCNAVKFESCRICNYLMIAGVNQKGLLLLLLWLAMWKWNGKCLLTQLLHGRLFLTHSRTLPNLDSLSPWCLFFLEVISLCKLLNRVAFRKNPLDLFVDPHLLKMLAFFLLWCACGFVLVVFKKNPSPQFLRAKEPLMFTGSPYVDASDEGVWRLLLNVYLRLKIGKV